MFIALTLLLRQSLAGRAEHSPQGGKWASGQSPIVATPFSELRSVGAQNLISFKNGERGEEW